MLPKREFSGALRDTVLVLPVNTVTIVFDPNNLGKWPLRCHHLYHTAIGMMSYLAYDNLS
ncbi:MAG TPA: hypothetical protein DCW88_02050 [Agrobacterium sp.]|uniref:multicopper oxidase domain-containing protein n=1 Tax=Agrobacterium TaxID=357 RepID=UPI000DB854D5|nr:MAG: hypothetical protein DI604_36735 [Delftia acidovorans]RSC41459.1 hypothetical protein EGT36_00480 [Agrobacterium sp. FDAARGOS_525]HAU74345.1 hypothetical protein [Agrobacterium sp.]